MIPDGEGVRLESEACCKVRRFDSVIFRHGDRSVVVSAHQVVTLVAAGSIPPDHPIWYAFVYALLPQSTRGESSDEGSEASSILALDGFLVGRHNTTCSRSPMAEALRSDRSQCGFESHREYLR
jgi:hypothetical protein